MAPKGYVRVGEVEHRFHVGGREGSAARAWRGHAIRAARARRKSSSSFHRSTEA